MPSNPKVVICVSGKRKSGKDYMSKKLVDCLAARSPPIEIVRLSVAGPIKKLYAASRGLDYERLLGTSDYKESVRRAMVDYSDEIRRTDLDFFIRHSIGEHDPDRRAPVWIVTDVRRVEDMEFFERSEFAPSSGLMLKVRVHADLRTRERRGFTYTADIDDYHTECALDEYNGWDYVIRNSDGDMAALEDAINKIHHLVSPAL